MYLDDDERILLLNCVKNEIGGCSSIETLKKLIKIYEKIGTNLESTCFYYGKKNKECCNRMIPGECGGICSKYVSKEELYLK